MSILRRLFIAGLWLGLAAAPADAGLAPARASQIVTLITGNLECPLIGFAVDRQLLPDGGIQPFSIPDKQVLIVTEVDWFVSAAPPSREAAVGLVQLTNTVSVPFFSDGALTDAAGNAHHVAAVANAVVGRGGQLCVFSDNPSNTGMVVRGFLAPDR